MSVVKHSKSMNPISTYTSPSKKLFRHVKGEQSKSQVQTMSELGQGSFGIVNSAIDADGELVAIKKVKIDPSLINREANIHSIIRSPYCVRLKRYYEHSLFEGNGSLLFLVMEHMPTSLDKFLSYSHSIKQPLNIELIREIAFQIFMGLKHIHSLGIMHRDIKPENILMNPVKNEIKLCDFGSAKFVQKHGMSSSNVGSRFFQAPELLLGCCYYDFSIDIWAAGCVIAQMLLDDLVLFQGNNDIDQIKEIIKVIGPPSEEEQNSFVHPISFPKEIAQISTLELVLPKKTDSDLLCLLQSIFVYNPQRRPTAEQCLENPFFNKITCYDHLPPLKAKTLSTV